MLRRVFGPKRGEVTGEWRKLHNEELNELFCSLITVRHVMSSGGPREAAGNWDPKWGPRTDLVWGSCLTKKDWVQI